MASWLDERLRACADATVSLGSSETSREACEAVLTAVAPRFVECVAAVAGVLRRRGRDAGTYLKSHAEAEQRAVRDRVRQMEEPGEPMAPGRTFRRRANMRRTVDPPLVAHETTRKARERSARDNESTFARAKRKKEEKRERASHLVRFHHFLLLLFLQLSF